MADLCEFSSSPALRSTAGNVFNFVLMSGCRRFVGTEEGILELKVNIEQRKTFPAMSFR